MSLQTGTRMLAGLVVAAALCCGSQPTTRIAGGMALPFVENDFAGASAQAKEAKLPLFVEVWAPW